MRFPKVVKVRQDFPRPRVGDVGEALREQFAKREIRSRVEPGAEVAITAGSRGIAGIDAILRSLVEILKEAGARPFLVPAMASALEACRARSAAAMPRAPACARH